MRWIVGGIAVLVAIVGFFFWQNLTKPKTVGLVNGRLHPCPNTPNCVCCCHDDETHYIAPLPFTSEATLDQIQAFLIAHYNGQVVRRTPEYLDVVVTTPMMRFKDDLEFAVDRQNGTVKVRSASRMGYSDGGINRERIEALRTYLTDQPINSRT